MNRKEVILESIDGQIREKRREIEHLINYIRYEMTNEEMSYIEDAQEFLEEVDNIDCLSVIRSAAEIETVKLELAKLVSDRAEVMKEGEGYE